MYENKATIPPRDASGAAGYQHYGNGLGVWGWDWLKEQFGGQEERIVEGIVTYGGGRVEEWIAGDPTEPQAYAVTGDEIRWIRPIITPDEWRRLSNAYQAATGDVIPWGDADLVAFHISGGDDRLVSTTNGKLLVGVWDTIKRAHVASVTSGEETYPTFGVEQLPTPGGGTAPALNLAALTGGGAIGWLGLAVVGAVVFYFARR